MKKDNKKLLLSVAVATVLMNVSLQAGDIKQNLGASADAFTVDQPAGTELMRVGGNGNVGIATATPTEKLDINGKMRIRDTTGFLATDKFLSIDSSGVIHETDITVESILDALNTDKDGDGISDEWETFNCTSTGGDCDPAADLDNDGLTNLEEFAILTDPEVADTDGDGVEDGQEITDGTNPLDPASFTDHGPDPLPGNIVLSGGQVLYLGSVSDTDYAPYTAPTGPATLDANQAADGGADTAVDIQGTLDATGRTINIPYTVSTSTVSLPAFSKTITVPANVTEDGISKDVTLSYPAQTIAVGTGIIQAKIKTTSGVLNAKKLDIQKGIGDGTDTILENSNGSISKSVFGYLMGAFTIAINAAGDTAEVQLRDIAGIPDRMMGQVDNNGNTDTHNFLYLPVTNPSTGKTWLNNNLGANYTNVNHASFNINQQATSEKDYEAYGSLFQWGRQADGHELITWQSETTGVGTTASVSGRSATSIATVGHFLHGNDDWLISRDDALWANEASINNVCPVGYRLPLNSSGANNADNEFYVESESWTSQNAVGAASGTLKLTLAGDRNYGNGEVYNVASYGDYWSSSVNGVHGHNMYITSGGVSPSNYSNRGFGFSVRCIKD